MSLIEYGGCSNPGQVHSYFATRLLKSFELLLTLLSLGVRRVFKPAGAIGVFNTSTKMEAYHEDKFTDSTDRLLKLRRNPNKMDVIRRLQGHFVDRKISHLLESPSLSFRISSEETDGRIYSAYVHQAWRRCCRTAARAPHTTVTAQRKREWTSGDWSTLEGATEPRGRATTTGGGS